MERTGLSDASTWPGDTIAPAGAGRDARAPRKTSLSVVARRERSDGHCDGH
jgi:hypothetical protein